MSSIACAVVLALTVLAATAGSAADAAVDPCAEPKRLSEARQLAQAELAYLALTTAAAPPACAQGELAQLQKRRAAVRRMSEIAAQLAPTDPAAARATYRLVLGVDQDATQAKSALEALAGADAPVPELCRNAAAAFSAGQVAEAELKFLEAQEHDHKCAEAGLKNTKRRSEAVASLIALGDAAGDDDPTTA